jgi:hypothetical protein
MVILFDHGTPRGIARALQGHTVKEARAQGWDTLNNGDLLRAAEEAGFDVLLTTDTNLPHQQFWKAANWRSWFPAKTGGAWGRPKMQEIAKAVEAARPGTCTVVTIPPR